MLVRWIDAVPMAYSLRVGVCPVPQQQKCNTLHVTATRTAMTMTSSFPSKCTALINCCSLSWPTGCFSSWIILLSALPEWLWSRESGQAECPKAGFPSTSSPAASTGSKWISQAQKGRSSQGRQWVPQWPGSHPWKGAAGHISCG